PSSAASALAATKDASAIVSELLVAINGTDRGAAATATRDKAVVALIQQLENCGQGTDWLSDPTLFGNYAVSYVSVGNSENSNPAGGRFRGRFGRSLFRTEALFQHILRPDCVVNSVLFRIFGVVPCCVTLHGTFEPMAERRGFVRACFEMPRLSLGRRWPLTVRVGPTSGVQLSVTYLDERIRLGRGGRGSAFVFERC
ncbi:unnamed protein product, partial [Phaeothamnion confervicola]